MAGEFTGVGLGIQSPDIMTKLSGLLSLKAQQQGLAGQAADVQMHQQSASQRANLAKYDWSKHIGDDGTIDLNSLNDPDLRSAAGDQYLDVVQHAISAKQSQLEAKKSLVALKSDQRDALSDMLGPLLGDKDVVEGTEKGKQKINDAFTQYGELYGKDVLPVIAAYAPGVQKAPPHAIASGLRAIQLQAQSASQQVATQQPNYVNTGPALKNVNPNAAADASADVQLGLAPGLNILTDQAGAQFAFNPQTNTVTPVGTGRGGAVPPGGGPPSAPPAPPAQPFRQPTYPGQAHDIATQQTEVQNIRATADRAPLNRNIYKHVLTLADDTNTGQLAAWAQKNPVIGQMFGDNYQELGKYLEKNAIENMTAMGGPPSDARLSAATAANGSTHFNAKALKAVTQFNYATNTGLEKYRQGIDKAIGTTNPDYGQLPAFKSAWAQNFDVDVFRLENAIADGNKAEKAAVLDGLSPQQASALIQKRKNLESLAATGHLPQ